MSHSLSLKTAERNSFKLATYTDGFNDISLGVVLVLLSVFLITCSLLGPVINAIFILGTTLILVGAISYFRNRLVPLRVGLVKFGKPVKKRLRNAVIMTILSVGATLVTWFLSTRENFKEPVWTRLPQWVTDFNVDIIFSFLIIGFFFVLAYSMAMPRFYLYGLLIGIGNLVSIIQLIYFGVLFQYHLEIAGLVITGIGVYLLIRFLKMYSVPTEEA